MSIKQRYLTVEERVVHWARTYAVTLLRYAFALIYFWYGFLKVLGISPADELVYRSIDWIGFPHFGVFLGMWEMIIGVGFAYKPLNRLALLMFFLKIPGTFFPLFTSPEKCFTIFPYGLTLEGQYIFKNLIMIAAALVLVGSLRNAKPQR